MMNPKHAAEPERPAAETNRLMAHIAWGLVALTMFLALIILATAGGRMIGEATAERPAPTITVTPGPDTIAPPPLLAKPIPACDPIFQRCEVAQ